jgi:cytoskeletal protein CcmA (bactofilin family)
MFKLNKNSNGAKAFEINPNTLNLIGSGTTINGTLDTTGDIRIDGTVKGNVTAKGKVVLGEGATVTGNLVCQNADISGNLKGNLTIDETLVLKSTARIDGDIITSKLMIEAGANFNGRCQMGNNESKPAGERKSGKERELQEA